MYKPNFTSTTVLISAVLFVGPDYKINHPPPPTDYMDLNMVVLSRFEDLSTRGGTFDLILLSVI